MAKRKCDDLDGNISKRKQIVRDCGWKSHFIHNISVPTVESVAAVTIVIQLWKQYDVRVATQKFWRKLHSTGVHYHEAKDLIFGEIEGKVLKKVKHLSLPKPLKRQVSNIVKPIGLQILKWINPYRDDYCHFTHTKYIDSIYWTMQGTIDNAKTLELYFANFKNIEEAYYKACKYCLEGHIYSLWMQMPEELQKSSFYKKNMYRSYKYHFVAYWTCSIRNELANLLRLIKPSDDDNIYNCSHSIDKNMFAYSVFEGNILGAKYFRPKLTNEEMCNNVVKWAGMAIERRKLWGLREYQTCNEYTDILCFLLSQVNDELQREVFQNYGDVILQMLFLDWPWQKLLLPTIVLMWDFLDSRVYVDLLLAVIREIKSDKNTEKLLKDLWCNSPVNFKKCFIQHMVESGGSDLLLSLYKIQDYNTVMLILNDADVQEKQKIIFSTLKSENLFDLFYADKSFSLKMLVEKISSESEVNDFKNNLIMQCGNKLCHFWIRDNDWQSVETLLEWCFTSECEINEFKKEKIDKFAVFRSLACVGNYELVDRFMNWCFSTDEEIKQFKEDYLCGNSYMPMRANEVMVELGYCDEAWNLFEKLMSYCFSSEQEISQFKELLTRDVMETMIHDIIAYGYNFEFSSKLLAWRFPSKKEIDQFKRELSVSCVGMDMFYRLASDFKVCASGYSNKELIKKLTKWYHPCVKEVVVQIKKMFEEKCSTLNAQGAEASHWKSLSDLLDSFVHEDNSDGDSDDRYSVVDTMVEIIDDVEYHNENLDVPVAYMFSEIIDFGDSVSSDDDFDVILL